jgi:transcriptional regulator with XRE-family HTH domain
MELGTIGSRLREKREKIGYSQSELAEKAGVTARSQRNYEAGTRVPDATYLAAIAPLGIDINYVLNGRKSYEKHNDVADGTIVLAIQMAFGISNAELTKIVEKALVNDDFGGFSPILLFNEMISTSSVFRLMADQYSSFDAALLAATIGGVESVAAKANLDISSIKKASAIVMLYRAFKSSGKIDIAMIEDTVKLASLE